MQPEEIITYDYFFQEATHECYNLVDSNWWEPTDKEENYQVKPSILKADTVEIEDIFNKTVKQFYFKIRYSGKYKDSSGGLSTKSVVTCQECGKKVHIQRYFISNETVLMGINLRSQREIPQNGSPRSLLFHMLKL